MMNTQISPMMHQQQYMQMDPMMQQQWMQQMMTTMMMMQQQQQQQAMNGGQVAMPTMPFAMPLNGQMPSFPLQTTDATSAVAAGLDPFLTFQQMQAQFLQMEQTTQQLFQQQNETTDTTTTANIATQQTTAPPQLAQNNSNPSSSPPLLWFEQTCRNIEQELARNYANAKKEQRLKGEIGEEVGYGYFSRFGSGGGENEDMSGGDAGQEGGEKETSDAADGGGKMRRSNKRKGIPKKKKT
jgi:hypothetical protein